MLTVSLASGSGFGPLSLGAHVLPEKLAQLMPQKTRQPICIEAAFAEGRGRSKKDELDQAGAESLTGRARSEFKSV